MEGPAGTGKTFGLCLYAYLMCVLYPGARILFVRATRASMNESLLQLWEEEILGIDHPAVVNGAEREHRRRYVFPEATTKIDGKTYKGRSRVVLAGMDTPSRVMSTQFDVILYIEATEGTLHQWDYLSSRNRSHHMPFNLMVADVNPADEYHWLNLRADEAYTIPADLIGKVPFPVGGMLRMFRVKTHLSDNPKYYDQVAKDWTPEGLAYRLKMEQQSGANYARLVQGEWVTADGQIWENFSRAKHVVQGHLEKDDDGFWFMVPGDEFPAFERRRITHFVAGFDWGWHPDPGVGQLWGVDEYGGAWLILERYECKVSLDDWAETAAEWQAEYDVRAIVCDPSGKGQIAKLNDRIGRRGGRVGRPIAIKADNEILAGCDQVRWGFNDDDRGEPRIRILDNASTVFCAHRKADKRPQSWVQEIGGYVYAKKVDGKVYKEKPDGSCEDHGCDTVRYVAMYLWDNRHGARKSPDKIENPGTIAAIINRKKYVAENFKRGLQL